MVLIKTLIQFSRLGPVFPFFLFVFIKWKKAKSGGKLVDNNGSRARYILAQYRNFADTYTPCGTIFPMTFLGKTYGERDYF